MHALDQVLDDLLFVVAAGGVDPVVAVFQLHTLVDEQRGIAAVVNDQLRAKLTWVAEHVERAFPVLLQRLALPGEHRQAAGGHRGGHVVLGREDVARGPADRGAQLAQGLGQHGGFLGDVQRAGQAHALERLFLRVTGADLHQARHFFLGHADAAAAQLGEGDIADLEVLRGVVFRNCVHGVAPGVATGKSHR